MKMNFTWTQGTIYPRNSEPVPLPIHYIDINAVVPLARIQYIPERETNKWSIEILGSHKADRDGTIHEAERIKSIAEDLLQQFIHDLGILKAETKDAIDEEFIDGNVATAKKHLERAFQLFDEKEYNIGILHIRAALNAAKADAGGYITSTLQISRFNKACGWEVL